MSANKSPFDPGDSIPIPPRDAEVLTTACDYCIVACGYKIYRWPLGKNGGPDASDNALDLTYPVPPEQGGWISPQMHNIVTHHGKKHHVVVVPDRSMKVVNKTGDHSIRGGCLAQKCFTEDGPTKDRLQYPMLRVRGKLQRISWDDAIEIFARVSQHVLEKHGVHAWAQKQFSYAYFENTYALTRFALHSINTPAFAEHDNPSVAPSTPGFRDAGFDNFAACYEDWYLADTLMIIGTDPYETKTIIWNEWILKAIQEHGQKVIFINPRKSTGIAFAEEQGGLHLQLVPGTDTILLQAIQRVILENGWEDGDWIKKYTANKWETDSGFGQGTRNTPWQWRSTWGNFECKGFEDYKEWLLSQKESQIDLAAQITGVDPDDIEEAAAMMAEPSGSGVRTKASIGIEKGCYWSNNYSNTAAVASLALLCGTGNRPGQMLSRLGGHQRGMMKGGKYPIGRSPEKFAGRRRKTLDLDRWTTAGHVRFAYLVGATWIGGMAASKELRKTLEDQTIRNKHQLKSADRDDAIRVLKQRVDDGGMMLVHQEIYLRPPVGTDLADLILPASGWGEDNFTRCNGERRLRLYSKFYDAPGEAKSDWWIVAQIAKRMGFDGYDWENSNDVFEEAARFGRKGILNYFPLVWMAKRQGKPGHELLREYGTEGIQCPIRYEEGKLVGTKRLHDSTLKLPALGPEGPTTWIKRLTKFKTQSGKANFIKSPWWLFSDFWEWQRPKDDELWITNGRINEIWQSGYDDVERRPYITQRWPENFMEINPEDAAKRGIESGDYVEVWSDRVPVQTGGFVGRDTKDLLFSNLMQSGHIKLVKAKVKAVAMVSKSVGPGVSFMYFLDPKQPANALAPRVPDPITNNYRFKLGVGKLKRTGESPYKKTFTQMSFASRIII